MYDRIEEKKKRGGHKRGGIERGKQCGQVREDRKQCEEQREVEIGKASKEEKRGDKSERKKEREDKKENTREEKRKGKRKGREVAEEKRRKAKIDR